MKDEELLAQCSYTYITRDGTTETRQEEILKEHSVSVFINGSHAGNITCIAEHLELLILGRLLTEGLIHSVEDVRSFTAEPGNNAVQLELRGGSPAKIGSQLLCGNHTGNDSYSISGQLEPVTPVPWKTEWIFGLADHFAAGFPLHEKTWATHSCILARDGEILFACEDISRHNALDKVIGYALKNRIPLTQVTVYSSGRIPTDMAAKAIRAGIPILVSKASPTAAAIRLAESCQLTLICAARRDRMKLFAGRLSNGHP